MKLGFVSAHFESGTLGIEAISNNPQDPGGKSYGIFQLSKATLIKYIQQAPFEFEGVLGEKKFDDCWLCIAKTYAHEFYLDQYLFVTKNIYLPISVFAKDIGYNTTSRRIQEAIFSSAVQHGGVKIILADAFNRSVDELEQLQLLYQVRANYVEKLKIPPQLKTSLRQRYRNELQLIVDIQENNHTLV